MKVWLTAIAILGMAPAPLLAQTDATTLLSLGEVAATDGAVSSMALPAGAAYEWKEESPMGCNVTFKARNGGQKTIDIVWTISRVRARIGWWKSMGRSVPTTERLHHALTPGLAITEARTLSLACNARRRYDIALKVKQYTHHHYYPSSDRFTQRTTIDLGDLNRFFP